MDSVSNLREARAIVDIWTCRRATSGNETGDGGAEDGRRQRSTYWKFSPCSVATGLWEMIWLDKAMVGRLPAGA